MLELTRAAAAGPQRRLFSTDAKLHKELRIGYVPEHFSTPLHFATKHFRLNAQLRPFRAGTGHMIQSLKASEIDVGIGLTEAWVADLAREKENACYKFVGTYVESPLCWAISTGAKRGLNNVDQLMGKRGGKKCGVSRLGSGSHVMSFVLADNRRWLSSHKEPFEYVPLENFELLRKGINSGKADFFMWEHFTSKRYWDKGEIKRIGEIYTPWPSWMIVARNPTETGMQQMSDAINQGITWFNDHQEEAVEFISTELDYSSEDAHEWYKGVKFSSEVKGADPGVIDKTIATLSNAGVVDANSTSSGEMIAVRRASRADS